jgi:hypothetical protein
MANELRQQGLGRVRNPAEQHGGVIAEATLELASEPAWLRRASAQGGVADEQHAVLAGERHRGDLERAITETDELDPTVTNQCGRRERGPEVDPQLVAHGDSFVFAPVVQPPAGRVQGRGPGVGGA